jgi:hypothetical protein
VSGILAGLANELGFEFSRRFIDLPPIGYTTMPARTMSKNPVMTRIFSLMASPTRSMSSCLFATRVWNKETL